MRLFYKFISRRMMNKHSNIPFIDSPTAIKIDELLMSDTIGYSIDQLIEVAGLSVALAIDDCINTSDGWKGTKRILSINGPGNNGGDGLVASRYLTELGYSVDIFYPKRTDKKVYHNLVKQAESYSIQFVSESVLDNLNSYDLILDGIFGFSFKGAARPPFDNIIKVLNSTPVKIASIDIPSGWDVEKGNVNNTFSPSLLVSLTLPKQCAKDHTGIHYLCGRFVPRTIYLKLGLSPPVYKGSNMIIKL